LGCLAESKSVMISLRMEARASALVLFLLSEGPRME